MQQQHRLSAPHQPATAAAAAACRPAAAAAPAGRTYTLSIAVAASCIENAQNLELATLLAGQVGAHLLMSVPRCRSAALRHPRGRSLNRSPT